MQTSYWDKVVSQRLSRRRAMVATGSAAAAAFLAACGGDSGNGGSSGQDLGITVPITDETKSLVRGGTFKTIILGEPPNLDPHLTGAQAIHVRMNYSALLKTKPGYMQNTDGDIDPEILESWEISPDKLTITGKMVADTKFAPLAPVNGRAVDIQDILFSWKRFKETSPRRGELANEIVATAPILSITASDTRTLVIKLSRPVATIFSQLTGTGNAAYYIVPKEAENASALNLRSTTAGSGPYYQAEVVPSVQQIFKRNPGFKLDKRDLPYIDVIDFATLPEYTTGLAQHKAGNAHAPPAQGINAEDVLPTKRDVPQMEIMARNSSAIGISTAFGHNPDSPFKDERVRQAFVMLWDRDLFLETFGNISAFRAAGMPTEARYDNGLSGWNFAGWWLDPTSKDFGAGSRYFKYDPAEAKKLMSAAGFNNAVDYDIFVSSTTPTPAVRSWQEALNGMARDSGVFKPTIVTLNAATEYQTFRANKGKFSGISWGGSSVGGETDPAVGLYNRYHTQGSGSFGGDPQLDGLTDKLLQEFDLKKRISIAHDVQRYEGGKFYQPGVGGTTSFLISWPALRNKDVWQGDANSRFMATNWIDQSKWPYKKS